MNSYQQNNKAITTSSFQMEEREQINYLFFNENDLERKIPIGEFSYVIEQGESKGFTLLKYDSCIDDQIAESSEIQIDGNTFRPISFTFKYSSMNLDLDMVGEYEKNQLVVEYVSEGASRY